MQTDRILPSDGFRIDVGGRSLFLRRHGTGQPTVILESGLGGTTEDWTDVYAAIGQFTAVCCYDRAGLGQSDPAATPRTAADLVTDLYTLVTSAQIRSPYIVVAHSISGMHGRLFASQYPAAVAGLVLIDATHEDKYAAFMSILKPELQARFHTYLNDPTRNSEQINIPISIQQLRTGRRSLRCPVAIIARGRADAPSEIWPSADLQAIEIEYMHRFVAETSQNTFQIAAQSGHFIHQDEPHVVIAAIQKLVTAARMRTEASNQ